MMMRVKISLHWSDILGAVFILINSCRNIARWENKDLADWVGVEIETKGKFHRKVWPASRNWNYWLCLYPILVPVDGDVLHFILVISIIIFSNIFGCLFNYISLKIEKIFSLIVNKDLILVLTEQTWRLKIRKMKNRKRKVGILKLELWINNFKLTKAQTIKYEDYPADYWVTNWLWQMSGTQQVK